MPRRKCDAYKVFERNLERSRAFLRIFDIDRTAGRPSNDEYELLRGAVVFTIGALDALLHELVLEVVPKFGGDRKALGDALRAIPKDDPGLSLRLALAPDGASKEDEFRAALDDWLEKKSFQGVARVNNALTYLGVDLAISDFDRDTGVITAERLQHYTDLRHQMVHRGAGPRIVHGSAQECVDLIDAMATRINAEVVVFYNTP